MTREQLYNLVWSKPMTHLANEFGISDVAIRKHCKKLDIPTPYVGYWTKLEHGKRVRKPPLSRRRFPSDALVDLSPRPRAAESIESLKAAEVANKRVEELREKLAVPKRLSTRPHALVSLTKERLNQAKADNHGLLTIGNSYHPSISVGRESIQRVLRVLSTLIKTADSEGQNIWEEDGKYYWRVCEESFVLRIYETKVKSPHVPTNAELKEQARRDKWRAEHPDWYSSGRKSYRTWDCHPSGRLTLELSDSARYGWRDENIQHRWRDRKTKPLEDCLADIFIWLASAKVIVHETRIKHEDALRVEAAAREKRRIEKERRQKAKELERYILELAEAWKTTEGVSKLLHMLSDQKNSGNWPLNRLVKELQSYENHLKLKTKESAILAVFEDLELDQNAPLLIPCLSVY